MGDVSIYPETISDALVNGDGRQIPDNTTALAGPLCAAAPSAFGRKTADPYEPWRPRTQSDEGRRPCLRIVQSGTFASLRAFVDRHLPGPGTFHVVGYCVVSLTNLFYLPSRHFIWSEACAVDVWPPGRANLLIFGLQ